MKRVLPITENWQLKTDSVFQNREEAGLLLAEKLKAYKNSQEAIVSAIPRGGVVVGEKISKILNLPLSAVVVKKLGAPYNPELAIGAVAPDGIKVVDWNLIGHLGIEQEYLDKEIKKRASEVEKREKKLSVVPPALAFGKSRWRAGSGQLSVKNKKVVILTDDGVATGATTLAAIEYVNKLRPKNLEPGTKIILAVPVIARDTVDKLKSEVEQIVALEIPESFGAVGQFYREFPEVTDEEVIKILASSSLHY